MEDKDLDRLLNEIKPPSPSGEARKRALQAAMEEFEKSRVVEEKNTFKGFAALVRLMGKAAGKLFPSGGGAMERPVFSRFVVYAFSAIFILGIAFAFKPMYLGQKAGPVDHRVPSPQEGKEQYTMPIGGVPGDMGQRLEVSERVAQKAEDIIQQEQVASEPAATVPSPAPGKEVRMKKAASPRTMAPVMAQKPAPMGYASGMVMMERDVRDNSTPPPMPQEYVGRDNFEDFEPNPVKLTSQEPVSTFSIDVDTASYAFVRRALNSGYLPQKDAVRVEEMINYFDYDYAVPEDKQKPFKPTVAVYPTPWNKDTRLLHIGIKGHDITRYTKPESNLVFLLDVSGSMDQPDKLPLLKNSMRMLVENLYEDDTVAIAVYAGAAGVVLEPTKVKDRHRILDALDALSAGGSTAGGEGIRLAYSLAERNYRSGAVNRVILATDGDFNVGIRNPEELQGFVERMRNKGIYLSVLGFGQGNYNDALMQKLAQNGNGNAAYIDSINEARKVLVDEAGSTLFTIAEDVKIQVEFNPARVAEYRLIGYETRMLRREDFNNDKVDAGEVGSGHAVTAIYEITPAGSKARLVDDLRYGNTVPTGKGNTVPTGKGNTVPTGKRDTVQSPDAGSEIAFLKIRYKLPDEDKSRLIKRAITTGDQFTGIKKAPAEMRFAASVAAFAQMLRGGQYTGEFDYGDVISLAKSGKGDDQFGYRAEFIDLVRLAMSAHAMGNR